MAGIIDIRFNQQTKRWTAKPRFAYDANSYKNGAASAESSDPSSAVWRLMDMLPEAIAQKLSLACPVRIYRSPEYEYMDDKCIEVDGHKPTQEEWGQRRRDYLLQKKLGHI